MCEMEADVLLDKNKEFNFTMIEASRDIIVFNF